MTDRPTAHGFLLRGQGPLEWTDDHERMLGLADRLWDDLRAIWIQSLYEQEMAEDATSDEELLGARAAVSRAEERVGLAFAARREWRQVNRCGGSMPELEAEITAAIEARREASAALWPVLRRVRTVIREELREIWQARDAQMYDRACRAKVRAYPELDVTTCTDVLRRFRDATKRRKGQAPRPAEMHETTSLYRQVQPKNAGGELVPDLRADGTERKKRKRVGGYQYGASWEDMCARPVSQIRLEPYTHPHAGGEWRLLVVPMGAPGTPVIRLPVRLDDRRPPEGAQIKGCRVVRRGRWWHAVLSIGAPPPEIQAGQGVLYAGINWRLQADGSLRILDGVEDDGVRYRVSLPSWQVAAVRYGDELQSALDRRANETAARLAEALPERAGEIREAVRRKRWTDLYALDPVFADGTHGRRGPEQHATLLAARRRVGSDPEKYAPAVAEILGDRAGRQRLEAHRSKALRRREHFYRACARWIAERFGRVVIAKSDGAKLARVEDPETGERTALPLPARRQRQAAAPYSLQQALRWAMAKAGSEVVDAPAQDRSRTCPLCGRRMDAPGREGELYLHCAEHGRWDRDHALAVSLWGDEVPAEERERWGLALDREERSRAQIVSIGEEVERRMDGDHQAYSRRRYVAGAALADRGES